MVDAINSGKLDIIATCRPSISDPFLPQKIDEGRLDDIRECIGCNICISRWEIGGPPLICTQNATAGEEYRRGWHPEKFEPARNADNDVLVVGAGPAGMECAMILGKRGMRRVHLVEAEDDMGGIMRWIPQLPGLGEWARVVNYRKIQIDKLKNVEFVPKTTLDAEGIKSYGAEIVVDRDRRLLGHGRPQRLHARHRSRRRREPPLAADARADHGRGQGGARREGRDRRQRRLLHGRLARREARPRRQEGHADDPPGRTSARTCTSRSRRRTSTASCTSSASRSSRTTSRRRSRRAASSPPTSTTTRRTSTSSRPTRSCS